MKIYLKEESYTFENSINDIQKIIERINHWLSEEDLMFSHLNIDGKEVYEEHEEYLFENINHVEEIEVIVSNIKEFIENILVSLNNYSMRAIPEIENIVNDFYQTPTEESWIKLNQLLEGIDWIYNALKSIDTLKHTISGWNEFIKVYATFEVELPNLMEAIENKDNILIADIIQYEILSQFQMIYSETEKHFTEQ